MNSTWGTNVRISIFGESHGEAIGVVLDGIQPGLKLDMSEILFHMNRRRPGQNIYSTPRKEADLPQILSGIYRGYTTGAPLCAVIKNTNTRSQDYEKLKHVFRPGHSDYTAYMKYKGFNDPRGGGHFSGRLTAPLVFAGSVCRQALKQKGITVGGHLLSVAKIKDTPLDPVNTTEDTFSLIWNRDFPVLDEKKGQLMKQEIDKARMALDSVGGVVEVMALGVPVGIGNPIFHTIEGNLAGILFSVPAVKGVEFGSGFAGAEKTGYENNDAFYFDGDMVKTKTNHHGGILGGISSGMPLVCRVAFKPTASISKPQQTVDIEKREMVTLETGGRHDPCIAQRGVVVIESAVCIGLLDMILEA